jgi:hypothetical protein
MLINFFFQRVKEGGVSALSGNIDEGILSLHRKEWKVFCLGNFAFSFTVSFLEKSLFHPCFIPPSLLASARQAVAKCAA